MNLVHELQAMEAKERHLASQTYGAVVRHYAATGSLPNGVSKAAMLKAMRAIGKTTDDLLTDIDGSRP